AGETPPNVPVMTVGPGPPVLIDPPRAAAAAPSLEFARAGTPPLAVGFERAPPSKPAATAATASRARVAVPKNSFSFMDVTLPGSIRQSPRDRRGRSSLPLPRPGQTFLSRPSQPTGTVPVIQASSSTRGKDRCARGGTRKF